MKDGEEGDRRIECSVTTSSGGGGDDDNDDE